MNTSDINVNRHLIERYINEEIITLMKDIPNRCEATPQEPDYVAFLTIDFMQNLFEILKAVFPKKTISITGIYCHQKPIVNIGDEKKPELGDLLLVYKDQNCKNKDIVNSLLFQAKITNGNEKTVGSNEKHQLNLYKTWPKFTYHRAGKLNGQTRDIQPKTITAGAQYLLINPNAVKGNEERMGEHLMSCALPDDILKADNSFAKEIINFFKFRSGRIIDNSPNTQDDWSKMIWDLLHIAFRVYSRRSNIKKEYIPSKFSRENECIFLCNGRMKESSLFQQLKKENEYDDEECAVPVVIIETIEQDF